MYNGFCLANLSLDSKAEFTSSGLLKITNDTTQTTGHVFCPEHIKFKNSTNGSAFSFSTTFVFGIILQYLGICGHGIAFVIAPQRDLEELYLVITLTCSMGSTMGISTAMQLQSSFVVFNQNWVGVRFCTQTQSSKVRAWPTMAKLRPGLEQTNKPRPGLSYSQPNPGRRSAFRVQNETRVQL